LALLEAKDFEDGVDFAALDLLELRREEGRIRGRVVHGELEGLADGEEGEMDINLRSEVCELVQGHAIGSEFSESAASIANGSAGGLQLASDQLKKRGLAMAGRSQH